MTAMILRSFLLAWVFVLGVVGQGNAESCETQLRMAHDGILPSTGTVRLERLTAREALSLLGERGERSLPLSVRRTVLEFWRYKARRSIAPRELEVRYLLNGRDGSRGDLYHRDDIAQTIPVTLIPHPPKTLCSDGEYHIIAGGFDLHGLASDIGRAGTFALEIDVNVVPR